MIRIYDKDEHEFKSLGLGYMDDAIRCEVKSEINKDYYLEMDYPVSGSSYKYVKLKNIIYSKSDLYKGYQPYRIYEISEPLEGNITIKAHHISYDLCGFTVDNINNITHLSNVIDIIEADSGANPHNLYYFTMHLKNGIDPEPKEEFQYIHAINLRELLTNIIDIFDVEIDFDGYNINIYNKIGEDRGLQIRYSHNLTNMDYTITDVNEYTGIFPYFARQTNKTTTTSITNINKAYVADEGSDYCWKDWLYLDPELLKLITWLTNEQMYMVDRYDYSKNDLELTMYNPIFAMVPDNINQWWRKATVDTSQLDPNNDIIYCEKFKRNSSDDYVDFYSYEWLIDDSGNYIYPDDNRLKNGLYIYCMVKQSSEDDVDIPESFQGEFLRPTELKLENSQNINSIKMWTHAFNAGYINPNSTQKDEEWLLVAPGSSTYINPEGMECTGEIEKDGVYNDFGGDILPFVILGPSDSPDYMKVYEWNKFSGRYKEAGSGLLNKIKNLFRTITGKNNIKETIYRTLEAVLPQHQNGIIYLNDHSYADTYQKILTFDMSDYIDEDNPTPQNLLDAYNEHKTEIEKDYIKEETDTTVSFIDISEDPSINVNIHLELGDLVHIINNPKDIDISQRIHSITYDAIKNIYIELSVEQDEEDN